MTDDKKTIVGFIALAEEHANAVEKLIANADKQTKNLQTIQQKMLVVHKSAVDSAVQQSMKELQDGLKEGSITVASDLRKASAEAKQASKELKKERELLGWKYALIAVGSFFVAMLLIVLLAWSWVPSLDEIHRREIKIAKLDKKIREKNIKIAKCVGGSCVQVNRDLCSEDSYCLAVIK